MSQPKQQHYVPQCYLREWIDPTTPPGQEPYLWIFDRNGRNPRRKAPKNILRRNDLYTLKIAGTGKNYSIEQTLSQLEGEYASVFRTKITQRLPLSEYEHILLCAFAATMLQRTLRHRDTLEYFFDELISHTESLERQHNIAPTESRKLRTIRNNAHRINIVQLLPDLTKVLTQMSVAFLCADRHSARFVTSDDPCNLFNPDLQWQRFYGPGLGQKNVQLTLPLSPNIMMCMSWTNFRGYIAWDTKHVDEANRMVIGHCYRHFISHRRKTKRGWFRAYPIDALFILKIVKHKVKCWLHETKMWYRYRHVRRR